MVKPRLSECGNRAATPVYTLRAPVRGRALSPDRVSGYIACSPRNGFPL